MKGRSSEGWLKSNLLSNDKINECSLKKALLDGVKRERDGNSWKMQWLLRYRFLSVGLDHPVALAQWIGKVRGISQG